MAEWEWSPKVGWGHGKKKTGRLHWWGLIGPFAYYSSLCGKQHSWFEGPSFASVRIRIMAAGNCKKCARTLVAELQKASDQRMFPHTYDVTAHARAAKAEREHERIEREVRAEVQAREKA